MNPPPERQLRCALYSRISPLAEARRIEGGNYSLASQRYEMMEHVRKQSWHTDDSLWFEDNEISGERLDNRPALEAARELVRSRNVDILLAYSSDRLTRTAAHLLLVADECERHKVKLEFVRESYADSPEGKMMMGFKGIINQYEKEKFRERSMRCKRQKAREGSPVSGAVPFGYIYHPRIKATPGNPGRPAYVTTDPSKVQWVQQIFAWAASGKTAGEIARELNRRGVLSAKGGMWSRMVVHQLIHKGTFLGRMPGPEGIEIPCEALVDEETMRRIHACAAANKKAYSGRPTHRQYLLTGVLWCARCGHRYTTAPNNGYPIYRCGYADYKVRQRLCPALGVAQNRLEPAIWNCLWDAVSNPAMLIRLVRRYHAGMVKSHPLARDLKTRHERLKRLEQRAIENLNDPDMDRKKAKAHLVEVRSDLIGVEMELRRNQAVALPPDRQMEALCRQVLRGRDLKTFEGRRAALRELVSAIQYEDGEFVIRCQLPAAPAAISGGENCLQRIDAEGSIAAPIPFEIKGRVA